MLGRDKVHTGFLILGLTLFSLPFLYLGSEKASDPSAADSMAVVEKKAPATRPLNPQPNRSQEALAHSDFWSDQHIIRQRKVSWSDLVRNAAEAFERNPNENLITLSTFDSKTVQVEIVDIERPGFNKGVISARVKNDPFSMAVLSWVGNAISGSLHAPSINKVYEIRYAGGSEAYISEIDTSKFGHAEAIDKYAQLESITKSGEPNRL